MPATAARSPTRCRCCLIPSSSALYIHHVIDPKYHPDRPLVPYRRMSLLLARHVASYRIINCSSEHGHFLNLPAPVTLFQGWYAAPTYIM